MDKRGLKGALGNKMRGLKGTQMLYLRLTLVLGVTQLKDSTPIPEYRDWDYIEDNIVHLNLLNKTISLKDVGQDYELRKV